MRTQGCNADGVVYGGPYDEHERVQVDASSDGITRQEFADECDINTLMARYEKSGVINHIARSQGNYFDATDVPDLAAALAIVAHAEDAFMRLPAKARAEFDNDAVRWTDFAADPANLPRMREWGLAPPAPVEERPLRVQVVPDPAAPPPAPGPS